MSTTRPLRYPVPSDPRMISIHSTLTSWYEEALRDEDQATDPESNSFYWGLRVAYSDALRLLFGAPVEVQS